MRDVLASARARARRTLDYARFKLNRTPVIMLGNQKSGTSAIAHLLADCCGLSKTIDIPIVWDKIPKLKSGAIDLESLARQAPGHFMTEVIKEPHLTFVFDEVLRLFPDATYVFIVRDPRDNIRSILDRLGMSGKSLSVASVHELSPGWASVVTHGESPSGRVRHIYNLSRRWSEATRIYFRTERDVSDVHLVRYEDFMEEKERYIRGLARRVGREPRQSISDRIDIPFQPRGANRGVDRRSFFSAEVLQVIERICGREMARLGYDPSV